MKNIRINITEDKFRILLENWSRYRSEEISPPDYDGDDDGDDDGDGFGDGDKCPFMPTRI